MKDRIVGVDIGGTKISLVVSTLRGQILHSLSFLTRKGRKAAQSVQEIQQGIAALLSRMRLNRPQIKGIGICAPGPIDPRHGILPRSPNMLGWEGIPLKHIINLAFHVPVYINNDANAACLAVYYFGEGKRVPNMIYVTVSTGIGGGMVLNGQLVLGKNFFAGEIGHTTLVVDGPACNCGKRGCLEALSSGTAIARMAEAALRKDVEFLKYWNLEWHRSFEGSKIRQFQSRATPITSREVKKAAAEGDRLALAILDGAGYFLGVGLANLINTLNPSLIALGGGVLRGRNFLFPSMRRALRKEAWPGPLKACQIVRTKLGRYVNDLGAVALALYENGVK